MDTSHFEIPSLIPPLPSSTSAVAASANKENQDKERVKPIQAASPGISKPNKRQPFGVRTPLGTQSHDAKKTTTRTPLGQVQQPREGQSPSCTPLSNSATKKRAVLRYCETIESLFCIKKESSKDHYRYARGIVEGSMADDPEAWCRVMEFASKEQASASDLTRLHRRATLRFPAETLSTTEKHEHVLAIWLSFAQLHAKIGSIDEARRTFRHIEHQKTKLNASFYISFFEIEKKHDPKHCKAILRRGIKERAEPVKVLEQELTTYEIDNPSKSRVVPPPARPTAHSSPRRNSTETNVSPKRRKLDHGFVRPQPDSQVKPGNRNSKELESKAGGSKPDTMPKHDKPKVNMGVRPINPNASSSSKIRPPVGLKKTRLPSSGMQPASAPPRQKLLSSRLGRTGLSGWGKAKRVEPGESYIQNSDSDEDDTDTSSNESIPIITTDATFDKPKTAGPKIKKVDLSYMWEWDPNSRRKGDRKSDGNKTVGETSTSSGQSSIAADRSFCSSHDKEMTDTSRTEKFHDSTGSRKQPQETTSDASRTIERANVAGSQKALQIKQVETNNRSIEYKNDADSQHASHDVKTIALNNESSDSVRKGCSNKNDQLIEGANREFLELVHETNILRVNGAPYAKLAVIGKGGSCKVYRTLSKDRSVVAIKKVKLEGLKKRAIEGYANEIALLKRLKGNPSIIQMYDSQVDLKKKCIFLVMELGEVDLNHVLQKRAISGGSRCLDINFIRLTWQQMLSAVHSIHEERIIHSDLKPANFLFVRGALKLIDFGIAKAIQNDNTTNIYRESTMGTLNYMSPEAMNDTGSGHNAPRMKIGRASDVWSLGCILYEMVYGATPFAGLHFIQKINAIATSSHQIEFPEGADEDALDAMKQCLRRNPEERPPIWGKGGLLNEHRFLHSGKSSRRG